MAAPIGAEILGEILPYLGIRRVEENNMSQSIMMEDLTGLSIEEATKILKELSLEYEIANEAEMKEGIVIDQLPKKGIMINIGTKIIIYTN